MLDAQKLEIRSSKSETNTNYRNIKVQKKQLFWILDGCDGSLVNLVNMDNLDKWLLVIGS